MYCSNITDFVKKVQELREFPSLENVLYKLYIDEGQGKLMISLSIVEWMCPSSEREKGRFKTSGVKKIFILACAPCKEVYENVRVMFEKLGIAVFPFEWKLSADLKFINLFCGLGPHSSTFPCYICTWRKGSSEPGSKRTFASIKTLFEAFQATEGGESKDFYRCSI